MKDAFNTQYLFNLTRYTASPSSGAVFGVVNRSSFHFLPRPFSPQSIFHSFQKWVIFIAYDKRIIKGNVVDFSFPLNCGTHKHGNSHIGVFKCLTTFVWDIWSISAMSRVLWLGLFLIHFSVWSSVTVDLPKLSWSSRSKFPLLNLANHLQTVLSPSTMASSP